MRFVDELRNDYSERPDEYAIRAELRPYSWIRGENYTGEKVNPKKCVLWYSNFERGHSPEGKVIKDLPNGIIFKATDAKCTIKLTELTMEEFEKYIRPNLLPEVSEMLNDPDDVYTWCRQQEGIT